MKILQDAITEMQWFLRSIHQGSCGDAVARILSPTAPEVWKLFKYLTIGVLSVVVFYAFLYLFRFFAANAFGVNLEENRFLWNSSAIFFAFVPTNFFTYFTNRKWVFVAGRHESKREFLLFTIAAAASFIVGEVGVYYAIIHTSVSDFYVSLVFIAMTTFFNYGFRKKIVFHE
jgi:putative flippase GtrA